MGQLYANDEAYGEPVTVNDDQPYVWENLYMKDEGGVISYSVREVNVPYGYSDVVTGNADDGFIITNKHIPEKTQVHVSKIWINFMAAITISSDFGVQENKVCHCFHVFPLLFAMKGWMGLDAMMLVF